MKPKTAALTAIAVLAVTLLIRDVYASQPPPEQVEEAAEAAQLTPDQYPPCIWLSERMCITPEQWKRLTGRPAE